MFNIRKRTKDDASFDDEEFYDGEYYGKDSVSSFDEEPQTEDEDVKKAVPSGVSFGGSGAQVALKVFKPKSYDDGPEIADYLAGGSTVLLNIEFLDKAATKRLIDFLLGATHVLGGTMKMVARGTFVFAPRSVGVAEAAETEEDNAVEVEEEQQ